MNETLFKEILGEFVKRNYAEFDNAPEHKFSLKHRIAMKRIFARYDKNTRKNPYITTELSVQTMPRYRLKQKIIIALVIVILMTLLTGWFIPLYRVSQAQIDWLRSRYDFRNMKVNIPSPLAPDEYQEFVGIGNWTINDDYVYFLYDLEQLGIYTFEETEALLHKFEPNDTRPDRFKNEPIIFTRIEFADLIADLEAETPLSGTREFVSDLENKVEYYTERSKDKERAVEGDAEYAANIRDNYLPLHKSYLELLEKLYAERSDDESSETLNNVLLVLDKDDRRYLFKINEFEKF